MKKTLSIILSSVLAFSVVGCSANKTTTTGDTAKATTDAKVITLRVAHNQTSLDNPYQFGLVKFADVLKQVSGGKMVAEVYPGTLGTNENELAMKLTTDSVDM